MVVRYVVSRRRVGRGTCGSREGRGEWAVLGLSVGVSLLVLVLGGGAGDSTGETTRVSVSSTGEQADWRGYDDFSRPRTSISADGRYAAFASSASTLVAGDTNGVRDVFVRDAVSGSTSRVSLGGSGAQGNKASGSGGEAPSLSEDGRYVAFSSSASNLVVGDTNRALDVFVRDRQAGTTARVSVATGGGEGSGTSSSPSISADGRYVAFFSYASNLVSGDTNNTTDVFVHDRQTGTTTRVSVATGGGEGNGASSSSSASADGRYVAFGSHASNLVDGDTNNNGDVFVHDRQTGTTTRLSVATGGGEGNGASSTSSSTTARPGRRRG